MFGEGTAKDDLIDGFRIWEPELKCLNNDETSLIWLVLRETI